MDFDNYYELRGGNLYKRLTDNGKKPISREVAETLSTDDLKAIMIYTFVSKLDFEYDLVAFESHQNVVSVDLERNPLEEDNELQEIKEHYKMDNDELGYFLFMKEKEEMVCGNCRYFEECPAEYMNEQPNYCENWEHK